MQIFSFEMKPEYLTYMAAGMVLTAVPTIVALLAGVEAPYGRYADKAGKVYGFPVNGRLAWILQVGAPPCASCTEACRGLSLTLLISFNLLLQELPSFAVPATLAVLNRDSLAMQSPVNKALLGMFLLHYTQRLVVGPGDVSCPCLVLNFLPDPPQTKAPSSFRCSSVEASPRPLLSCSWHWSSAATTGLLCFVLCSIRVLVVTDRPTPPQVHAGLLPHGRWVVRQQLVL